MGLEATLGQVLGAAGRGAFSGGARGSRAGAYGALAGAVIGAGAAVYAVCTEDDEDDCEQHRKEDEAACAIPIIRYGYARGKACLDSAMIRYSECLRFGIDGIRTPLHGVDTPL